ncbi:aminoacyltransferase, partial [Candidatus Saccharibacteria bacterium]|nr:aminoacyltransferase [Candidatus Saccharibacteria bacterium]
MPWLSAQSAQWQAFQAQFSEANFLQSWQWGEVNERAGHVVIREVYLSSQANSVATVGWMGFVKNARRGRYLEVPGGPLLDWTDQVQVSEVLERIKKVARQHGCVFVRLRPQAESNKSIEASLSRCGARKAPMHLHAEHTNVMSLTPTEDELLAAMRRQTRYEIRRASKRGVRVEAVTANEAIDEFYTLQADTARRQGFVPPSKSFLAYQAAGFKKQLVLYRAYKDKQLLNAALVINDGREAVYHEAASTEAARREPGAYALVWQ